MILSDFILLARKVTGYSQYGSPTLTKAFLCIFISWLCESWKCHKKRNYPMKIQVLYNINNDKNMQ